MNNWFGSLFEPGCSTLRLRCFRLGQESALNDFNFRSFIAVVKYGPLDLFSFSGHRGVLKVIDRSVYPDRSARRVVRCDRGDVRDSVVVFVDFELNVVPAKFLRALDKSFEVPS